MSTDVYSTVLFNDGEGVDHGDFNNLERYLLARMTDQTLARKVGYLATASTDPDIASEGGNDPGQASLAYTLTGGDCVIAQGSTTTKVKLLSGTLLQRTATPDGTDSKYLVYTVRANDVDLTIGAGDGSHPRIDILQVKLEWIDGGSASRDFKDATTGQVTTTTPNKTRRVQATFSIKAGTPAATPSYPAPDSGYAMIAAVRVPTSWSANFDTLISGASSATLLQCSIPLGVEAVTVTPNEFDLAAATNWSVDATSQLLASGGAATNAWVWCPRSGSTKRIVGIAVYGAFSASASLKLQQTLYTSLTGHAAEGSGDFDLSSALASVGSGDHMGLAHLGVIADASPQSNPSAANGPVGDAFWTHGGRCGPAVQPMTISSSSTSGLRRARLKIDGGNGSKVGAVVFFLAG